MRFRTNRILEKNREGRKGIGLGLVSPNAEASELVGMLGGFDFVHLDGEHGVFSPESIDEMCRVADGFGLTVTARVPGIDGSTINSYLDRGVTGIWGPHIETAEEAQALVDASLFGPDGQRSRGGGRGNYYNNSALIDIPGGERDALGAKPVRVVFHEVTPEATGRRRRNGGPGSSPNQAIIGKGLLRSKLCAPILDGHRLTL